MSVGVVAAYPWKAARKSAGASAPGVVVCTDTRLTWDGTPADVLYSKQRLNAPNIALCFTSNHARATESGLREARGKRSIREIGRCLREAHRRYHGLTEMIAVVWRDDLVPHVLEVMPPDYKPVNRTGVIGIGHGPTLEWFRKHAVEDPESREGYSSPTPELIAAVEKKFGPWTPPDFTIEEAAMLTAAALATAIEAVGDGTVSLPVQAWAVSDGNVENLPIIRFAHDLNSHEELTAKRSALARLRPDAHPAPNARTWRSRAMQIFD